MDIVPPHHVVHAVLAANRLRRGVPERGRTPAHQDHGHPNHLPPTAATSVARTMPPWRPLMLLISAHSTHPLTCRAAICGCGRWWDHACVLLRDGARAARGSSNAPAARKLTTPSRAMMR